jgi:hypothetical protein
MRGLDIQLVEDFFSGGNILAGKNFRKYVVTIGESGKRQTYYEWFQ